MIIGTVKEIWRYPVKSMGGEMLANCMVGAGGIPGDRGWALRDEQAGEIRGAKHMPLLLQCSSRYPVAPGGRASAPVQIVLPDGEGMGSADADANARLSALLGRKVSLWPLQPASDKAHYRRGEAGVALLGALGRSKLLRPLLNKLLPHTPFESMARELLKREAGEPGLDYATLPADLLEFTSPPGTYFDLAPLHLLTTASLAAMRRINPDASWDARRFRPNLLIETVPGIEGLAEADWGGRTLRVGGLNLTCSIPTIRCGMVIQPQGELAKDASVLRSIVRDARQEMGIYASAGGSGRIAVGDTIELL